MEVSLEESNRFDQRDDASTKYMETPHFRAFYFCIHVFTRFYLIPLLVRHAAAPPFRKRSRSHRPLTCKRIHNGFGSLPTFYGKLREFKPIQISFSCGSHNPEQSKTCSGFLLKENYPLLFLTPLSSMHSKLQAYNTSYIPPN